MLSGPSSAVPGIWLVASDLSHLISLHASLQECEYTQVEVTDLLLLLDCVVLNLLSWSFAGCWRRTCFAEKRGV